MKKAILYSVFLVFVLTGLSQSNMPESAVNIGAGFGQPFGGLGAKGVVGYKNSGVLVGLGHFGPGITGYTIGAQVSVNSIYFNLNYGTVVTVQVNEGPAEPVTGGSILFGGMIGLGSQKRLFIDLGLGYSFGTKSTNIMGEQFSNNVPCFSIGLGYRIPK
jgi:hypothetical protein